MTRVFAADLAHSDKQSIRYCQLNLVYDSLYSISVSEQPLRFANYKYR